MTGIRKSDFYKRAARRIASQKVILAKIAAAQRYAPRMRSRSRDIDTAHLGRILKSAELLLSELATSRNADWHEVKDELDDRLHRFDTLAKSESVEIQDAGRPPTAAASSGKHNHKVLRNIS